MLKKASQSPQRTLLYIISLAVLLRVASSFFLGNTIEPLPGIFDQTSYHNLAIRVLDGHGFSFGQAWWPSTPANQPTAHWSYLYTTYMVVVYALFGVNPLVARLIQAVAVGILMPLLLYRLALQLFPKEQAPQIGLLAAAISAVYVYFFYYAAALITESFYIVAILWSFHVAIQIVQSDESTTRHWLLLGVALGTAVLLRQLFMLFIPFLFVWLLWAKRPNLFKFAIPTLIILLMMLPWTIRNYYAFGLFVPLNTNSGYAFFWGNHPSYGTRFVPILPTRDYYDMIPEEMRHGVLNEAELDNALRELGMANVWADPVRYMWLSLSRIPHYFIFWPSAQSSLISNLSRVLSFGLFLPFMLYGLWLSLRRREPNWQAWLASPFTLLYLFFGMYAGVHILTWTLIRYRLPLDGLLVLFAGWALVHMAQRFGLRQSAQPLPQ